MITNNGWIKIHRKIKEKGYYNKSEYVHLWIHLLLEANHGEKEFMWNKKLIKIKPGQFITGLRILQSETGIKRSTVDRILKMFENETQIEQQITTKFRLITIKNWEQYQKVETQNEKQVGNKWETDGKQMGTNKNDKNYKNEKNIILQPEVANGVNEILNIFYKINPTINFQNNTQRKTTEELIKKFGKDKIRAMAEYAVKIFGQQYAPTITNPLELKNKMSNLGAYFQKNNPTQNEDISNF